VGRINPVPAAEHDQHRTANLLEPLGVDEPSLGCAVDLEDA
jgi:hypothetical protein